MPTHMCSHNRAGLPEAEGAAAGVASPYQSRLHCCIQSKQDLAVVVLLALAQCTP